MIKFFRDKSVTFYIQAVSILLMIVGTIFFGMSYTTGYNQIVYGEMHSIAITVLAVITFVILVTIVAFQSIGVLKIKEIYNVAMAVLAVLLILCTLFLLVDRIDAIGNCIVAPWDAGHGGEDSCYLAFVAMGCWLVSMIGIIVGCFLGHKVKDVKDN